MDNWIVDGFEPHVVLQSIALGVFVEESKYVICSWDEEIQVVQQEEC